MKKNIFIFCFLVILISFFCLYFHLLRVKEHSFCPFCDEKIIRYQKYYEDGKVIGLYSHKPLFKGHCLIIPKRHVEKFEDLEASEVHRIFYLIKKTHFAVKKIYNVKSYLVLQKNGKGAGQSVPHLHFHYIPNRKYSSSGFRFLVKFLINPFMKKIEKQEMEKMTKFLSKNMA
jgi:diadenosine tetraphosphate (Ap4A) HIT family hydrolase